VDLAGGTLRCTDTSGKCSVLVRSGGNMRSTGTISCSETISIWWR
jgi:hypothetical protein